MEAVVLDAQLLHEVEGEIHLSLGALDAVETEGLVHGVAAEHIGTGGVAGVPPGQGEAELLGHGLAADDAVLVVVAEGEGVLGLGSLKGDSGDLIVHGLFPFWV